MRLFQFLLGVVVMSVGIALSLHAGLGTSPISAFPAVMAVASSWTVGQVTIAMNLFFVLVQIALLRSRFRPVQLFQVPVAVVFGLLCDLSLWATRAVDPQHYLMQWLWTLVAGVVLAVGVYLQVRPRLITLPGEGLVVALSTVARQRFSSWKTGVDVLLVAISAVLSLVLLGEVVGIREGTVVMALMVGPIVRLCGRLDPWGDGTDGPALVTTEA